MAAKFLVRGELRLKNALLVNARKRLGMTQTAFAATVGMHGVHYCNIENLRVFPSELLQERIAAVAGHPVDALFPAELRAVAKAHEQPRVAEVAVEPRRLLAVMGRNAQALAPPADDPEHRLNGSNIAAAMQDAVAGLTLRERLLVSMRFGLNGDEPMTVQGIGDALGMSHANARYIEISALRKLRRRLEGIGEDVTAFLARAD